MTESLQTTVSRLKGPASALTLACDCGQVTYTFSVPLKVVKFMLEVCRTDQFFFLIRFILVSGMQYIG